MPKFIFTELVDARDKVYTARCGAGTGTSNHWSDAEVGKLVKLAADSRYDLCAAGDPIDGVCVAVETATLDNYTIGSIRTTGRLEVTFDGSQAAGTGSLAVGDFVVAGTVSAKGTALTAPVKVRRATYQPGVTEAGAVGDVNDMLAVALRPWRVVSLGSAGTGAVGTTGIIERM